MTLLTAGFQGTVQWVLQHGYFLLFILMLIEGPVVTAAGAFAAALSYFHLWIVLSLSILANLIPDLVYYALGYWGRHRFIDQFGHYFGLTKKRIAIAEKLAKLHTGKSLFAIKMIPLLATPGLIVAGATKMNFRKYAFWCVIITIPSSLIYLLLGYYFGAAYDTIDHYLHIGAYVIVAGVIIILAIFYFQRKYADRFLKKFEEED
jgi:membrane protein DedA with SNARE-associated domain